MNILGIGPQIFFILILALLLFGPKKMLQFAYQAGRYVAQIRAMWEQTMQTVQKEFKDAGLDVPPDVLTRRFDIGAEAQKIINQSTTPSVQPPSMPTTVVTATLDTAAALIDPIEPIVPSASVVSSAEPSLDVTPPVLSDDEQSRKYDAWLPS